LKIILIAAIAQIYVFFGRDNLPHKLSEAISMATFSIDMVFHQVYQDEVVDSLISAHNRGVKIRVITEHNYSDRVMRLRNAGITVVDEFNDTTASEHIMHHKFMIIDFRDADTTNDLVWNGSYNASSYIHADNALLIRSHGLARIFEAEFYQMWGDTGNIPDSARARTGNNKSDTAPFHTVYVNGTRIDVYFSPQNSPAQIIERLVSRASSSVDFCIYYFTHMGIASSFAAALDSGVTVRGVYESSSMYYSHRTFELLQDHGAQVYVDSTRPTYYFLHHKFMVIDDSIVETGSMNWTLSANYSNDENIMIIYNRDVARAFEQEFVRRFQEATGGVGIHEETVSHDTMPTLVFTKNLSFTDYPVRIYTLSGRLLTTLQRKGDFRGDLAPGVYIAKQGKKTLKFLKIR